MPEYLQWAWNAFWTLHGDRQQTMGGPGPIPFTAIARYAETYRVHDLDYLVTIIGAMDRVYMEHARAHFERRSGRAGRGGRRG